MTWNKTNIKNFLSEKFGFDVKKIKITDVYAVNYKTDLVRVNFEAGEMTWKYDCFLGLRMIGQ